jgi:membrane protein implicated in regulation of membrane protease activity
METLSNADGSAEAVRDAADAALIYGESRHALERELDRLNTAIQGSAAALGAHLSWLLLAQALLLAAYLVVLVAGWSVPLPGKRWLLAGVAGFALFAVVATYLGLRAARDRVGPLKLQRQRVEEALERVAGRPPAFARQGAVTAALAQASTRGLPLAVCAGWAALLLYTLAVPLPTDAPRAAAAGGERPASRSADGAGERAGPASASANSGANGKGARPAGKTAAESPATATTAEPRPAQAEEGGVIGFFRRALGTPAAENEPVKP